MYGRPSNRLIDLMIQAEHRVRAGETQADVADALGIPRSTLADWARGGKWRRRDLVAVRDTERAEEARVMVAHYIAAERKVQAKNAEDMQTAIEAAQAEVAQVTPAGLADVATSPAEAGVAAHRVALAMANELLRQGRLEDADRAVRLSARFAEAEQAVDACESAHWRGERERLTAWWADRRRDFDMLKEAIHYVMDKVEARQKLEDSRSVRDLCPACGRNMDFWPEDWGAPEKTGETRQSESGESGESADSAELRMSGFSGFSESADSAETFESGFPEFGEDEFP